MANNELFIGGWRTSQEYKQTTITAQPLDDPKVFRLKIVELVDSNPVQFKISADDKEPFTTPLLFEGGAVFVEGTTIFIEQVSGGAIGLATWEVVQEPPVDYELAKWSAPPMADREVLVCSLIKDQQFVLSFNLHSKDKFDADTAALCWNGLMRVKVDGQFVEDSTGEPRIFLEGSSIIGKGRQVSIVVTGECSSTEMFKGSIKLRKYLEN
jgi:hypothetical protein